MKFPEPNILTIVIHKKEILVSFYDLSAYPLDVFPYNQYSPSIFDHAPKNAKPLEIYTSSSDDTIATLKTRILRHPVRAGSTETVVRLCDRRAKTAFVYAVFSDKTHVQIFFNFFVVNIIHDA